MANYENIIYDKKGRVVRITLNRPEKLNSLSLGLMNDLDAGLKEAEQDGEVRVIVIKGAGRAFCTGYDLSPQARAAQLKLTLAQDRIGLNKRIDAWLRIWDLPKIVIAQVHGFAIAGGSMLASICDLTIVAEDAQIGMPMLPIGSGLISPFWLPLIGPKRAKEYAIVGGLRMSGKEAAQFGWANRAVPAAKLEAEVDKMAKEIAKRPLEVLSTEKATVNRALEMGFRESCYLGAEFDAVARDSEACKAWVSKLATIGLKQASQEWMKLE